MTRPLRALLLTAGAVLPLGAAIITAAYAPWRAGTTAGAVTAEGTREIAVHAHAWGFHPGVIRVRAGERVRFAARTDDIKHGFAINELDVNLQLLPEREVRSPAVEVNLPEGTYAIHCSAFCGMGHPAMKARLVVGTPRPSPRARAPWLASLVSLAVVVGFGWLAKVTSGRRA